MYCIVLLDAQYSMYYVLSIVEIVSNSMLLGANQSWPSHAFKLTVMNPLKNSRLTLSMYVYYYIVSLDNAQYSMYYVLYPVGTTVLNGMLLVKNQNSLSHAFILTAMNAGINITHYLCRCSGCFYFVQRNHLCIFIDSM